MNDTADFEIYADGDFYASTYGPRDLALAEAKRYALEAVMDGGIAEIKEVTRVTVETLGKKQ